jgi:uncharacterized membrane protein
MGFLIAGVLLWALSHLMKRVAPGLRTGLGDNGGKLLVTALSLIALVLMVLGYRQADVIVLWSPPAFLTHLNNLLMLLAVFLLTLGYSRGRLRTRLRHPMLTSVKTWAVAHLLVNGDLASLILFGGLLAWAVVSVILINRAERVWTPPAPGPVVNDLIYAAVSLGIFAAIAGVHTWLGYWPFG